MGIDLSINNGTAGEHSENKRDQRQVRATAIDKRETSPHQLQTPAANASAELRTSVIGENKTTPRIPSGNQNPKEAPSIKEQLDSIRAELKNDATYDNALKKIAAMTPGQTRELLPQLIDSMLKHNDNFYMGHSVFQRLVEMSNDRGELLAKVLSRYTHLQPNEVSLFAEGMNRADGGIRAKIISQSLSKNAEGSESIHLMVDELTKLAGSRGADSSTARVCAETLNVSGVH